MRDQSPGGDSAFSRRERSAQLRAFAAPYQARIAVIGLLSFSAALIEATFLVTLTQTALSVAQSEDSVELFGGRATSFEVAVTIALGLVVARVLLAVLVVLMSSSLTTTVGISLGQRLGNSFLSAAWSLQQAAPHGRLQQLVGGFAVSATGVIAALAAATAAALSLCAVMAVSLWVSPFATVAVLAALVILGSALTPLRRRIRQRAREAADASMRFATGTTELGSMGLEMQTYGVRAQFSARLSASVDETVRSRRRADVVRALLTPVYTSLGYIALVGGIGIVIIADIGEINAVGAVMLLMLRSLSYGQNLQASLANLNASIPFLDIMEESLAEYDAARAQDGAETIEEVGRIDVLEVGYSYDSKTPAIDDITISLEAGEHVGVIGPSGGGKSTLVQLLLGLRNPDSGHVQVNGIDLRDIDRESWASRVAFVAQEAQLMTGTIADNVRFFREGISDSEVVVAIKEARLYDEVSKMDYGIDSPVGERGTMLSGGQRQRVSIARALVGKPGLLILDEPTSALDAKSEAAIRQTLAELRGEVTVVVIAHRLSTLEMCDRVMVIEAGRMAGLDTLANLSKRSDFYREAMELSQR